MDSPARQSWHCLKLLVPQAFSEDLSVCCFELGSCGLQVEEEGELARLSAYFESALELSALRCRLEERLQALGLAEAPLVAARVEEEDWEQEWRRFFRPVWATRRVVVHPSWIPVETRADQLAVVIDPKMAFGTGTHESTRLCLEFLEELLRPADHCLDLGAGSGILGIAAALLGAGHVTLVDIDANALENARENLARNGVEARAAVRQGSLESVAGACFDLVLANIQSHILQPLLNPLRQAIRPGRHVVLSGLLAREEGDFCRRVEAAGLEVDQVRGRGEWIAVAARRRG